MSTTVTYKGSTLTTVNNQTRTLKTAGKYMEGDVVLTDVSGGGVDVPVFTINDSTTPYTLTCNKSFIECKDFIDSDVKYGAICMQDDGAGLYPPYITGLTFSEYHSSNTQLVYIGNENGVPIFELVYSSNGSIAYNEPPRSLSNISITANGNYGGNTGSVYNYIDVDVHDIFVITANYNSGEENWLLDKTYQEIREAYNDSSVSQMIICTDALYDNTVTINCFHDPLQYKFYYYVADAYYSNLGEINYYGYVLNSTGVTLLSSNVYSILNLQTKSVVPSTSAQIVTPDTGYNGLEQVNVSAIPTMTLPTSAAASATSGYTSKATIGRSTAAQYINIPPGYNSSGAYYTISATPNGSATGPTSLSGTSATVSTGTNTLTLTKTGVTTTPNVSAGYVSSATASTATVTLTASVTTKAAATITPTTTNQTIASGTYLTGAQTIAGDADLVGSNIISTANIFGVQGTVVLQTVYTGSSAPSSSTGVNGDIYIQS